jgi:hypothetical protein
MIRTLYKCVFCGKEEIKLHPRESFPWAIPKGFMPLITGACGSCVKAGKVISMEDLDARCVALGESITATN